MPSQNNPTFTFEVQNMKKLAAAFLLGCGILMAGSASAEEKEFGPDFGRFIIDVPDGWNADRAAAIKRAVGSRIPVAVVGRICNRKTAENIIASGKADQVARGTAKAMGDAEVQRQDANHYILKAKDGVETLLSFKGDKCHSVTIIGDVEKVTSIVRSLRDK